MTGQAQAKHLETALVERLAQGPEAVGRIRHTVQQQYAAGRPVCVELEAAVPVGLALLRVSGATGAVAHQRILGPGCGARVDLLLQLGEHLVLQPPVVIEALYLIRFFYREFGIQLLGMPGLQRRTAASLNIKQGDRTDHTHQQGKAEIATERSIASGHGSGPSKRLRRASESDRAIGFGA